jgi:hypothetical protein
MTQHSDDWIEWGGGECPVEPEAPVVPSYRGPEGDGVRITCARAGRLAWYHTGEDDDIIAYRVIKP